VQRAAFSPSASFERSSEDLVTIEFVGADDGPATEALVTAPGNQFRARRSGS